MTLQEFIISKGIKSVFHYAAYEEKCFEATASNLSGYERKTTFYSDLSIAEWCGGAKAVKETFNRVCKEWKKDKMYFTEFVLCLNWKSWEWHDRGNDELCKLYSELYYKADEIATSTLTDDDLSYYYQTTD